MIFPFEWMAVIRSVFQRGGDLVFLFERKNLRAATSEARWSLGKGDQEEGKEDDKDED